MHGTHQHQSSWRRCAVHDPRDRHQRDARDSTDQPQACARAGIAAGSAISVSMSAAPRSPTPLVVRVMDPAWLRSAGSLLFPCEGGITRLTGRETLLTG